MKPQLFILPVTAAALVLVSGCKTSSHDSTKTSGTNAGAAVTTSAPAAVTSPVANKPALAAIRINAGSGAVKDSAGVEWLADTGFSGGDVIERPDLPIANTTQPEIYRSEHYSMDAFTQKLANGKYQVKLHFCETFEGISGPGERVFSFDVEGKTFKDFDVWVKAGGFAKAYVETVPVDITDGQLDIKFTPQMENPQINSIEIIPVQ
jgi:Malectin domain